jgi:multiple antibiotic resistance protein
VDTFSGYLVTDILTLFVVFHPFGVIPFYQGLTANATATQRKMISTRATVVVAVILVFFALVGDAVLGFLGITLHYIMIAGGLYILLFAVKDALGGGQKVETTQGQAESEGLPQDTAARIAIVPIATPLVAGPGAIATVMILNDEPSGVAATLVAIAVNAALTWTILRLSNLLSRRVGASNLMILNAIMNILIAAIGVAFIVKGTGAAFHLTTS